MAMRRSSYDGYDAEPFDARRNFFRPRPHSVGGSFAGTPFMTPSDSGTGTEDSAFSALLRSSMINLLVGPDKTEFQAHEAVLRRSPFFAQAFDNSFSGPPTPQSPRIVELPEEDPDIFASVLQYLYQDDFSPRLLRHPTSQKPELEFRDPDAANRVGPMMKLARIYFAADRIGLQGLMRLAARKVRKLMPVSAKSYLMFARFVYENTADADDILRPYVISYVNEYLLYFVEDEEDVLKEAVLEGGAFAWDLVQELIRARKKTDKPEEGENGVKTDTKFLSVLFSRFRKS